MVPRERKERPRQGSVRNFLEPQDFSSIELRASPVDSDQTIRDEFENSEDSSDLDIPVTEDSYQVIRRLTTHSNRGCYSKVFVFRSRVRAMWRCLWVRRVRPSTVTRSAEVRTGRSTLMWWWRTARSGERSGTS